MPEKVIKFIFGLRSFLASGKARRRAAWEAMSTEKKPGRRERNKQAKRLRIKEAAWELFRQKGFEATTTREVAERADIAAGTLFLYARDKRDLLLLVFHDELARTVEEAFSSLPQEGGLIERLVHIFGRFFRLYAENRSLGRAFLKELLFGEGARREEMVALTAATQGKIAEQIEHAKARGEVARDIPSDSAAANCFALYLAVLSVWLGDWGGPTPAPEQMLRSSLELQLRGFLPRDQEAALESRASKKETS